PGIRQALADQMTTREKTLRSDGPQRREIRRPRTASSFFSLRASFGFRILTFGFLLLAPCHPSALHAQPAPPPNRVLDLDGTGDYVRLPSFAFTNLSQATIEGWMKWRSFNYTARFFDFGERQREMYIGGPGGGPSTPSGGVLKFLMVDAAGNRRRVEVFGGIRLNEWTHVAAVTGPGGV